MLGIASRSRDASNGARLLPSAADDPTGQFSVATVSVKNIMEGKEREWKRERGSSTRD